MRANDLKQTLIFRNDRRVQTCRLEFALVDLQRQLIRVVQWWMACAEIPCLHACRVLDEFIDRVMCIVDDRQFLH